ncbi:hypothetical protein [Halomonas denitrificans]|nr:hypothetical protein [Halomonas denitrificans]
MKTDFVLSLGLATSIAMGLASSGAVAQSPTDLEAAGLEHATPSTTPNEPAVRGAQRGTLLDQGVLLVPESTNDRVMAFDPFDGTLIDADFIPADPTNLSTPIEVLLNDAQDTFLVSDQLEDGVFAYDLTGAPLGLFAPAGGIDNSILDNVRGMEIDPANGNLLVSTASGANADAIAEFDPAGNSIGNRVAPAAGGMDSPFDVLIEGSTIFAPSITSDAIHEFDLAGSYLGDFAPVDTFPEQMAPRAGGGYFVANFSGGQEGIIEFDAAGTVLNVLDDPTLGGYRGVYELGNGNLLVTNGGGVHEMDRTGTLVETEIGSVSARFISFVQRGQVLPEATEVPTLSRAGLLAMLALVAGLGVLVLRRAG